MSCEDLTATGCVHLEGYCLSLAMAAQNSAVFYFPCKALQKPSHLHIWMHGENVMCEVIKDEFVLSGILFGIGKHWDCLLNRSMC